ncbi:MAG TPA: DUF262 domain-containing HNH endonuclease family protein [Stellaceae bacterium]|nr:DUF262 domain-containing HNH endonuclease family protein [Stellaceae bacterium]
MQLNPRQVTLHSLLLGRLFRIPDYQRAYAWETKQRGDLFNDIDEVQRSGQDHFMATVVCLARDKRQIVADEYQAVDVVDGQQRLTTLVILLKAVEKALDAKQSDEGKIKREIGELLVKGDEHSLLLLQTNHDSSSVFIDYLRRGRIHNAKNIKTAADYNLVMAAIECELFVSRWQEESGLIALVAILRNRLSLIYHELLDESVVYRVFEVLNSRGLDVKWIDKVKSQLMALIFIHADNGARADAINEMHVIWKDIYWTLGLRGDLGDEALRFAGTWKAPQRPNRALSQEAASEAILGAAGTALSTINDAGRWLKAVVEAVNKLNRNVRLSAVTRIVHARFVATAILLREFPPDIEARLLGQWERVTFRIFGLYGADTRFKVGDYIRLGYDVIARKLGPEPISAALKKLGNGYSIEEIWEDIDWTQCYEGWTEELRYLMFRYDEYHAKKAGEKINIGQWNKIWEVDPSKSIEHITPQNSEEDYVHHLGNLTMLPPGVNSSLKDKPPAEKAATYRQCGLRGTVAVANMIEARTWNEASVLARAAEIEAFVREEWAD